MNNGAKITPMIRQYLDIKQEYPDHLLLFRMGDFYEMFFEDAQRAAKILNIALTSRSKGTEDPIPLCGVPHHALNTYLAKLIQANEKVAICDQLEDPRHAKGIVKRGVTRVVTPGVVIEQDELEEKANNYLMVVWLEDDKQGFALCDLSTGEFRLGLTETVDALVDELVRAEPSELIVPQTLADDPRVRRLLNSLPGRFLTSLPEDAYDPAGAPRRPPLPTRPTKPHYAPRARRCTI